MTDKPQSKEERQAMAAEHALRLLTGDELERARALGREDGDFAREVARWRGRLAPLAEEVDTVEPPQAMWSRITAATDPRGSESNVVMLRRRANIWRGATAAMTAIAASLAGVLILQPEPAAPPAVQTAPANPMVAMLGDQQKQMKVMASWDPTGRRLVLVVAGDMPTDPGHSHELWVIPADGKPRSLGTMGSARQTHMQLAEAIADLMQSGATVAISVEPPGGSPTGAPTGPVVASGALTGA
jgi:anti-sigma-K factor RskA